MKKNRKVEAKKKPVNNKPVIIGIIAIILVAGLFVLAYYFGFGQAGKAYTIGDVPLLAPLDLTKDPDLILTSLPEEDESFSFNITLNIDSKNLVIGNYTLNTGWLEEGIYQITLKNATKNAKNEYVIFGIDVLEEGDKSDFYINTNDNETDLKVSLTNGQLILKNPHFTAPGKTKMVLTNLSNVTYPLVISLEPEQEANFRLNATVEGGDLEPSLKIFIGETEIVSPALFVVKSEGNNKIVEFNWTAPKESGAFYLKIVSDVKGLKTTANYLLTVGDAAYLLDELEFPTLSLTFINKTERTANLTIEFDDVTDLQPLAIPCNLSKDKTIQDIFGTTDVKKIYSYANDPGQTLVQVWSPNAPTDLKKFDLLSEISKGYFLELAEAKLYSINVVCTIPILNNKFQILPPNPTAATIQSIALNTGWNLISIPGIVPMALDDLQEWPGLKLFECKTKYLCTEIKDDKILYPGKPYWIYAPEKQNLNFYYQQ